MKYVNTCNILEEKLAMLTMPTTIDLAGRTEPEINTQLHAVPGSEGVEYASGAKTQTNAHDESLDNQPISFKLEDVLGEGQPIEETHHPEFSLAQQELLHWHYRLNHLLFARIQAMAKLHILPSRLAKCSIPMCSGCTYGKMTKRPWRTKAPYASTPKVITKPGECVSVDQLDATIPGLITQLKGIPTIKRYRCATVFVDHFSRLGYVYLQQSLSSEDTMKAKASFEAFASTYGVKVSHYHADNGRFADNAFRQDLERNNQTISFCAVNAHWQNGVAEKRIRDLTENARTMLLFAQRCWSDAITANLWPYALRMANTVFNNVPLKGTQQSPLETFSGIKVQPQLRCFHHFGCPVYVLKRPLQQGQKIRKWDERARIGIYLGQSPQHAKTVALVLSLSTGNVSPQYHVQFDDFFETVTKENERYLPKSEWQ
jgi:transposase InsO family protein